MPNVFYYTTAINTTCWNSTSQEPDQTESDLHDRLTHRPKLDGSVKEKCRQGFAEGGKSSTDTGRYRYVLQLSVSGPEGTLLPLLHEEMDVNNPETEKEDCELKAFERVAQRLKKQFP